MEWQWDLQRRLRPKPTIGYAVWALGLQATKAPIHQRGRRLLNYEMSDLGGDLRQFLRHISRKLDGSTPSCSPPVRSEYTTIVTRMSSEVV